MINNSLLSEIVSQGESRTIEFQEDYDREYLGRAIASFLNAEGGIILIGLANDKRIVGVTEPDRKAEELKKYLASSISPKAPWSITSQNIEGHFCLLIDIPPGYDTPYLYNNEIFVRHGASVEKAERSDISRLMLERRSNAQRWERQPALGFTIEDIDIREVSATASEVRKQRYYELGNESEPETILERLNLMESGLLLNSSVILFAKNPAKRFPQARVRLASFKTNDKIEFFDNRVVEGNAFSLIEKINEFIHRNVNVVSKIDPLSYQRKDIPSYPIAALREGIMNAIVHRDYSMYDATLSIAIFPDRLEIWNPGRLPSGISIEDLNKGNISRPINPDMAHVFFLRGLIELWGIGTRRIQKECLEAGLPAPSWEQEGGGIKLTLRLKIGERSSDRSELNHRMIELLMELKPNQIIGFSDYHRLFASSVLERRARKDIAEMIALGYLKKEGNRPYVRYVRTEKPIDG